MGAPAIAGLHRRLPLRIAGMTSGPPHIPLPTLLARAGQGDGQAWAALVHAYTPRLFGLIVKQCGDRELAEEITQQTFVKIVTQIESTEQDGYQEQGKFESWIFRIAINALRDEMRRRKRQAQPSDSIGGDDDPPHAARHQPPPQPIDQLTRAEQIAQLRAAVAQLNEADREILHLRHTAGLSFAQIAQTLQQPLGTVLARAHRALAKLRKLVDEE